MIGGRDRRSGAGAREAIRPPQGLGGPLRRVASRLTGWTRCRRGVSAVEFALIAPVLGFSLIATVDLGFGLTERMTIDHVLRAGAQSAMADPGSTTVLAAMRSAAEMNFKLEGQPQEAGVDPLSLSATRFCACPENVGFAVACSTSCSGSKPTYMYYRMSAEKIYRGRLIPAITFKRTTQVQIR